MSIQLEEIEIQKVNVYLEMINQYNAEVQSLNYAAQKTNQSLKTYIDSVIVARNGQSPEGVDYVLNVDDYTLVPRETENVSENKPVIEADVSVIEESLPVVEADKV